jgi:hypothetical protein
MEQMFLDTTNLTIKNICFVIGIVGVLSGLDLVFGARVIVLLKRVLEKSIDIDKKIIDTKVKMGLGVIILVLSATILFLLTKIVI